MTVRTSPRNRQACGHPPSLLPSHVEFMVIYSTARCRAATARPQCSKCRRSKWCQCAYVSVRGLPPELHGQDLHSLSAPIGLWKRAPYRESLRSERLATAPGEQWHVDSHAKSSDGTRSPHLPQHASATASASCLPATHTLGGDDSKKQCLAAGRPPHGPAGPAVHETAAHSTSTAHCRSVAPLMCPPQWRGLSYIGSSVPASQHSHYTRPSTPRSRAILLNSSSTTQTHLNIQRLLKYTTLHHNTSTKK